MKMYEAILDILEKKGNATIPVICQEMSEQDLSIVSERQDMVEPSYIKTLVSSNNELFLVKDDIVSIRPDKEPVMMTVVLHGYPGPEMRVRIDFKRNTFTYFEWHLDSKASGPLKVGTFGSVDDFKKKLYPLKLWEWEEDYQTEGIVVDGTSWSVKLKTKGKTYESRGLDSFPNQWKEFCKAVSVLVGKKFSC
ncbi:hypothetical protein [Mesobacillus selenatarsenatis]|uniref:Uncharacterized protein n=1 Tax=Mesobacillus selenatarsenatis (strain DSM 18680 / JCM 14380 / FERM P-15431 / SF-1) TaxID=1321606 RepID=A0A0A8XCQ0_MESS1|nr:hypothetical protein [Mesobacillus selenatarsenatis]GAM15891.1 hypothetical protein SAMD00020551_4062 [Mesobacillus selenatarsenatis SF-1]